MLTAGVAGLLAVVGGLGWLAYDEPLTPPSGVHARIQGPFRLDRHAHRPVGAATRQFTPDQVPVAVVDWSSVPPGMTAGAGWFDDSGSEAGSVGPGRPGSLPSAVPIDVPAGVKIPPGSYEFVVGRYSGGRLVEVLARVWIRVRYPS